MSFYARGDKFTVAVANAIKKLWFGDASEMEEEEVRIKLEDGDYVLKIMISGVEKYIERTRSQERVYMGSSIIDDNSDIIFFFNVFDGATTVKLKMLGLDFPGFPYTELAAHDHGGQTFAAPDHIHTQAAHRHTLGAITVSSDGSHNHGGNTGSTVMGTYLSGGHVHSIATQANHTHTATQAGYTGNTTPEIAACIDADAIPSAGITGAGLNDTKKTNITDALQVFVAASPASWGTAKTKATAGWGSLANINADTGTDEIEIIALCVDGGFNYIKIHEPTAKKGGKIAWHISVN
jgi:hypothetical protein